MTPRQYILYPPFLFFKIKADEREFLYLPKKKEDKKNSEFA